MRLLDELVELMQTLKSAHILIDVRDALLPLTTEQEVQYGSLLAEKFDYFKASKIAIVSGRANPHGLIQAEAFTDGFRHMVEFATRAEAQDWLDGRIR